MIPAVLLATALFALVTERELDHQPRQTHPHPVACLPGAVCVAGRKPDGGPL